MKTLILAGTSWVILTSACFGQVRGIEAGSAEAAVAAQEHARNMRDFAEMYQKASKLGQELFGVDGHWSEAVSMPAPKQPSRKGQPAKKVKGEAVNKEYAGTLFNKNADEWRVGDWGCTTFPFIVTQSHWRRRGARPSSVPQK